MRKQETLARVHGIPTTLARTLAKPWGGVATSLGIKTSAICSALYAAKGAHEWLQATLVLVLATTVLTYNFLTIVLVLKHKTELSGGEP